MKKTLLFILAVILGLSSVALADMNVQPTKNASITVWETQGPEGDYIQYAAKQFEKKYAADHIKINFVPVEADKSVAKMQTAVQSGAGAADVFVFMSNQLGNAINGGLVMPNLVSANLIQKTFMPAAVSAATGPNGKVYGFPLAIQTYALYYNKKYFPNGVQSFEQLEKFAKTFNHPNRNQYAIMFDGSNFYYGAAFFHMYGGQVFGKKNGKFDASLLQVNSPAAVKGIQALVSVKPTTQNRIGKNSASAMMGLFGNGKVAAMIDGPWDVKRAESTGVDFGICALPTLDGKHLISYSGIRLMGVNPNSKYPKTAELFAKFATSPAMLKKRFEMVGAIPPVTALAKDPEIVGSKYAAGFAEQAKYSTPMPSIPAMAAVWDPMQAAIASAYNGETTVQKALDNAQNVIKQQIQMTYSSK